MTANIADSEKSEAITSIIFWLLIWLVAIFIGILVTA